MARHSCLCPMGIRDSWLSGLLQLSYLPGEVTRIIGALTLLEETEQMRACGQSVRVLAGLVRNPDRVTPALFSLGFFAKAHLRHTAPIKRLRPHTGHE